MASTLAISAALIVNCVAAFLAARLPIGWSIDFNSINSTTGLMIGTNLGFGRQIFTGGLAPVSQNYIQPLVFFAAFVPWIVAYWRTADRSLKVLFLTQVPLVLLSSLCFSWLYESRNYIPFLPFLTSLVQPAQKGIAARTDGRQSIVNTPTAGSPPGRPASPAAG